MTRLKSGIVGKFILYVLLFSIMITFIGTALQLYLDYNRGIKSIHTTFKQIESSYMNSIVSSLWVTNDELLLIQLEGILQLPNIQFIEIRKEAEVLHAVGTSQSENIIEHTIPLVYVYNNQDVHLGDIHFLASLKGVYRQIFNRVLIILIMQTINIFLMALFIFIFFYQLVGKHIISMASFAESIRFDSLDEMFQLDRKIKTKKPDELEQLVTSFNLMRENLARDIKQRKIVEESLRESEQRFRSLVGNMPGVSYRCRCDKDWTMVFISDEIKILSGYPASDFINNTIRSYASLIIAEDKQRALAIVLEAIDREESYTIEYRIITADGSIRWAYEKGQVIFDEQHKLQYLDGVIIDINDLKEAEASLKKAQNYISNIINSMPSILIGVNPEGIVTQWNNQAINNTGISIADAIGHPLEDIYPTLFNQIDHVYEAMKTHQVQHYTKHINKKDGKTIYEEVTIYPLTSDIEGAVIRIDNVTNRVKIEEMMVQSEKMLSIGGLAAGMAHEINNPLAGMIQNANVLANRLWKDIDIQANHKVADEIGLNLLQMKSFMEKRDIPQMIDAMTESGNRISKIINNMLNFSRTSNREKSSRNLPELIDKTIELAYSDYDLRKQQDFRKIEIIKEYENDLPLVSCEEAKIQQVLLNLFRNGGQAMQDEKIENPQFILRIRKEKLHKKICIEIEDNGPGMNEEVSKRIFEPFFTTKPTGIGTGLGLSISYFIITETHKGEMNVETSPGKGAKFIIRLPID